jgi:ribosomal protein L20A (L18A)
MTSQVKIRIIREMKQAGIDDRTISELLDTQLEVTERPERAS